MDIITGPWHWAPSGAAIAAVMFLLTWMGRKFGVSTIFNDFCNIAGAGKKFEIFNYDVSAERWRLMFLLGSVLGGFIAAQFLMGDAPLAISEATISHLQNDFGMAYPQAGGLLPDTLFNLTNLKGVIIAVIGGFLVGFGTRYAEGCTSGHAITGLSHLQLPSLLAVIGFFIGGLTMTWLIMPLIFGQ